MPARRSTFRAPARLPLVAPSILAADFAAMGDDCRDVLDHGADLLHLDVMDGHFVPNLTMGPDLCRALRSRLPGAFLDVHLMITDPVTYSKPFLDAGADHVTFHAEVIDVAGGRELCARIRGAGATAGICVNPATPAEAVFPFLDAVDLVLVMSVEPGFGGQAFMPHVLPKAASVRARLSPEQRLEIDGGITPETAEIARAAGCDVLVAGSSIFGSPRGRRAGAIAAIRGNTPP